MEILATEIEKLQALTMEGYLDMQAEWPSIYISKDNYYWFKGGKKFANPIYFRNKIINPKGFSSISFTKTGLPASDTTIILRDEEYHLSGLIYIAVQSGRVRWELQDEAIHK